MTQNTSPEHNPHDLGTPETPGYKTVNANTLSPTWQEEVREAFYEMFPAFKNRAYTDDTKEVIANWWIKTLAQELQQARKQGFDEGYEKGRQDEANEIFY